ncbi:hypothetical protein [Tenacibaculum amylolyticum]|uniref:hypothetical protein n=1 Tax=Tenacibaculum amylolyticum TaxID=104269 RepID=UPI003893DCA5
MVSCKKLSFNSIIFISILTSIISCKETPNYNPFDNQFNVSVSKLIKDKCDTIDAGCGYRNLQQNSGKLRTYYQVFFGDFENVLAKGFSYYLDTIKIDTTSIYKINRDSILYKKINPALLDKELHKFNYKYLKQENNNVFITNNKDTLSLGFSYDIEKGSFLRYLMYFKVPKTE